MRAVRRYLFALALLLAGCPKQPQAVVPVPPPPPPPPSVPSGCEASLAGTYRHHDDETFRYDITDDGRQVHIHAYRQFGNTRQPIASSAADIALARTPQGLRGTATTQAPTLSGARTCTVSFPYEVTACSAAQITLRTLHEVRLTESCQPEDALHPDFVENVLVREAEAPDAGALDAGLADAGLEDAGARPVDAGPDAGLVATGATDAGGADAGPILSIESDAGMPVLDGGSITDAGAPVTHGVGPDAGTSATP